ncbi:MAG: TonB-dependent receptor [Gammaproteobacteria bacterium]|nr:TonB-dependent receptor [Gammaproteobacteria bacterium]
MFCTRWNAGSGTLMSGNFLLRVIGGLVFAFSVQAAEPADGAIETETIVVTATRTAQTVDSALAPVIIIEREEIEQSQASDAAALLRMHAGVEIGRNGGPGQAASVFIRGGESNHTLVLIDGIKINPGTIGSAAIQNISPELIERIEIVKGPRSSLYGSDAIGGVINIITKPRAKKLTKTGETDVHLFAQAGEENTHDVSASAHHRQGRFRVGLTAGFFDSDGFPSRMDSGLAQGHDNLNMNAYAGFETSSGTDLELSHLQAEGTTEYVDFLLSPLDQDFKNSVSSLSVASGLNDDWDTALRLSYVTDKIDQNQSDDFGHTERTVLDWQNDLSIGEYHGLTAGLSLSREHTASSVFGTGFDQHTDVNAVFVQDNISYEAHNLLIAARYTDHEAFSGRTTANLAYGFQAAPATRLLASAGTAFRAPDSTDRFGFGGNPLLDPETSRHLELGLRHKLSSCQVFSANLFQTDLKNLITFDDPDGFLGPEEGMNKNLHEARIRGFEMNYALDSKPWRINAEAVIQNPESRGLLLARRAKRSITASLAYLHGRYRISADLLASSKRKDSDFSDLFMAGYGIVNLNVRFNLNRRWSLQAKLENLFDKDYELASGFNTQGRALFVGIRFTGQGL